MSDETAGEMVDAAQAAHPGSIYRQGLRITYLGEVTLETPPDRRLSARLPHSSDTP